MTMKLHQSRVVVRRDYTRTTTLCGRMNRASTDGMNIANTPEEVTCAFCRKHPQFPAFGRDQFNIGGRPCSRRAKTRQPWAPR